MKLTYKIGLILNVLQTVANALVFLILTLIFNFLWPVAAYFGLIIVLGWVTLYDSTKLTIKVATYKSVGLVDLHLRIVQALNMVSPGLIITNLIIKHLTNGKRKGTKK